MTTIVGNRAALYTGILHKLGGAVSDIAYTVDSSGNVSRLIATDTGAVLYGAVFLFTDTYSTTQLATDFPGRNLQLVDSIT
jgi:hypothetical protein